jgi:hypothetical protein
MLEINPRKTAFGFRIEREIQFSSARPERFELPTF